MKGCGVFVALFLLVATVAALNVDEKAVSISGLSSGAFMAVQYQVSFSSEVIGAAVFAGGPYYCANNNVDIALSSCMSDPATIDVEELVGFAENFADRGLIDDLKNLRGHRTFVYSGTEDTVVESGVVKHLVDFYQRISHNTMNITGEFLIQSEHTLPTDNFGNVCTKLGTPYVSKCKYDGAGEALSHLYGTMNSRTNMSMDGITELGQRKFVPNSWFDDLEKTFDMAGLAEKAFIYTPKSCRNGKSKCKLHVALHGCNQNYNKVSDSFYVHGGYNEWAESNNIVVLYPQAEIVDDLNPEGCWDWWGYTGLDYSVQSSVQMQTIRNMMKFLQGKADL